MKVFISWSGEKSKLLGIALRNWIPLVLQYVKPWLSDQDIGSGARWSHEIAKELEDTQFGIICVTKENLTAPWIFFEAGALSKAVTASLVCPYVLDVEFSELTGPLTQFQARKADKASTLQMLEGLNQKALVPIPAADLQKVFEALWPEFETKIVAIPQVETTSPPKRKADEILEELVVVTRSSEQRLARIETAMKQTMSLPDADTITEQDVISAFSKISYLRKDEIEGTAAESRKWLLRFGIRTAAQLNQLVTSQEILTWLEDVYMRELLRKPESPLDPLAVAIWGGQLFRWGFGEKVREGIIKQLRRSEEYAEKHKS